MAFAASYTVQKKRSRIHNARASSLSSSTGSASSTSPMGLSFSKALSSLSARTSPSRGRLEFVKGTRTRRPGSTSGSSRSGIA